MKICRWCAKEVVNPLNNYQRTHPECKEKRRGESVKIRGAIWYSENKQRVRENERKRNRANPKKHAERSKKWRDENPEKWKTYQIKWVKENPEKLREYALKWREKYPEKSTVYHKSRKIKIPIGSLCSECKKELAVDKHHPDYSKPLRVVFLCRKCHRKQ